MTARVLLSFIVALLALVCTAGCKRQSKDSSESVADCAAVGARLMELAQARAEEQGDALDERSRKLLRTQLPQVRDQVVKTCRRDDWPEDVRACFIAAASHEAFDACASAIERGETP